MRRPRSLVVPKFTLAPTASPSTSENAATGYPNGAQWYEQDAHKFWVKDTEAGGSATWLSTTLS